MLDGYGAFVAPPPTARADRRATIAERAPSDEHPPGLYGPRRQRSPSTRSRRRHACAPLDLAPLDAPVAAARRREDRSTCARRSSPLALLAAPRSTRSPRSGSAAHLAGLAGRVRPARPRARRSSLAALPCWSAVPAPTERRRAAAAAARQRCEAALVTRLAYVVTGDAEIDDDEQGRASPA